MPDAPVIDLDRIAAPLSETDGGDPAGENLRADDSYTSPYQSLQKLYNDACELTKRVEGGAADDAVEARKKWREVLDEASEFLAGASKDLEVAAWMMEAATRVEGFAGLCESLRTYRELVQRYWESAHPRPEVDGYRGRFYRLRAMIAGGGRPGAIVRMVRLLPIIHASERPLCAFDYNLALQYEKDYDIEGEREARAEQDGAVTLSRFASIAEQADEARLAETAALIESILKEVDALKTLLDERCPEEEDGEPVAPSFHDLRGVLSDECLALIREYRPQEETAGEATANGSVNPEAQGRIGSNGGGGGGAGPAASREEALKLVLEAAAHFRRTEPYSPISYALHEIVRWARMPFPQFLHEVVKDEVNKDWLFKVAGDEPVRNQDGS